MADNGLSFAIARGDAYRFLAAAFAEPDASLAGELEASVDGLREGFTVLADEDCHAAVAEVSTALAALTTEDFARAHVACFGHAISKECPPYECEYGQAHIYQKAQTLADIAGFYKAFGLDRAPAFRDRYDHLSAELEFMAFLCLKEAHALASGHSAERLDLCREAQRDFLDDHLSGWVLVFCERVRTRAAQGPFGALATLLEAFVVRELARFELTPPRKGEGPVGDWSDEPVPCERCPAIDLAAPGKEGMRP